MHYDYPALSPGHPIPLAGMTMGDYWAWAFSNILNNTSRGVFAEFVVASALGVTDVPRKEWDEFDLRYGAYKIEVKSSAYLQAWEQKKPSTPGFDVAMKRPDVSALDVSVAADDQAACRRSDCYVFCLYTETERRDADPLDLSKWEFYVVPTGRINEHFGVQKQARLSRIREICDPVPFAGLRSAVDVALGARTCSAEVSRSDPFGMPS